MAVLDTLATHLDNLGIMHNDLISSYRTRWNQIVDITKKIKNVSRHFHAVHGHPCWHTYEGDILTKSYADPLFFKCEQTCQETKFYPDDTFSLTELLLMEHSLDRDCDENGLIFTKHFVFNPKDQTVPKVLKVIQRIAIRNLILPRYNWIDYINIVPTHIGLKDFLKK